MRLLILSNKMPYPPKDGGAIATFSLAESLSRFFETVDICVINTKKHYFDINEIPDTIKNDINFHDVFVDTSVTFFGAIKNIFFSKLPYNAQRFITKKYENKLMSVLKKYEYDVVQFEGLYMLPYISVVRKYSNAIISYRAHNIEQEIWQRRIVNSNFSLKKIYLYILVHRLKRFEKSFINKYDALVPITDKDSKFFDLLGNVKSKITIPTGVKQENYVLTNHEIDFPSVFYIGALDWEPNKEGLQWFLKNVWPSISKIKPFLKFYIAGRNAPKSFEKNIKADNITFLGEIEDAKKYIVSKSIMVVPLFSGSGMRIKILEAMALSKAIISTTIGLEGIPAHDGENVLIRDSAHEMINAIIELSDDYQKIKELGDNARIFVFNNFNNFIIAKRLFDYYSDLVKIKLQ